MNPALPERKPVIIIESFKVLGVSHPVVANAALERLPMRLRIKATQRSPLQPLVRQRVDELHTSIIGAFIFNFPYKLPVWIRSVLYDSRKRMSAATITGFVRF